MIDITKSIYFHDDTGRGLSLYMNKVLYVVGDKCLCSYVEDELDNPLILFDIKTGEVETTNFIFYYASNED